MRFWVLLCGLLVSGCGTQRAVPSEDKSEEAGNRPEVSGKKQPIRKPHPAKKSLATWLPGSKKHQVTLEDQGSGAKTSPAGTSSGSDWPGFLGPLGTSVSPEKGIIAPWPKKGLRIVWHKQVGTGYGMPSISKGR